MLIGITSTYSLFVWILTTYCLYFGAKTRLLYQQSHNFYDTVYYVAFASLLWFYHTDLIIMSVHQCAKVLIY